MFLFYTIRAAVDRSNRVAGQLFVASIVYLPSALLLMLLDEK
jgi:heme O synthase-like polyprenyltransferase